MDSLFYIDLDQPGPDRFSLENFQAFINGGYDPITSAFLLDITTLESGGVYTINGAESRPDIIANEIYGDTQFWWVVMAYNRLTSVTGLTNGLQINFPSVDALEEYFYDLKAKQDAVTP